MFQISQEQYDALNRQAWRDFVARAGVYFSARYPDGIPGVAPERFEEFLRDAQRRAAPYGVEMEYAVARYAHLMVLLGNDFDTDPDRPEFREVLDEKDADDNERMDYLLERAQEPVSPADTDAVAEPEDA